VKLDFCQLTTCGDREHNEDALTHILDENYALFAVADGLGGHIGGEKASRYFCQGLSSQTATYSPLIHQDPAAVLFRWLKAAILEMKKLFGDDIWAEQAHTTCAVLYMDHQTVLTAHCGDSRVYRMQFNRILWQTKDHSLLQEMLEEGLIRAEDSSGYPAQNQLTRSINLLTAAQIEISSHAPIAQGETFVLCSDGFWQLLKEHELLQLAQRESGKAELAKLVRLVMYRAEGLSDNISVQLIKCR
jgi:serine/threonine protein phosphatase PrpC